MSPDIDTAAPRPSAPTFGEPHQPHQKTFASVDLSSWVSWICYWVGVHQMADAAVLADLARLGPGAAVLAGTIAAFFLSVVLIQRHMRLSLLANSYAPPSELVTTGPFRFSRNPIYLAFLLPIAGLAYYDGLVAFVTAAIYVASMTAFVIGHEERHLERQFGAEYLAYRARVPRWLWPF
ncbi:MAG: isoprenylcysteine carboxylmethyltransferase family protein [Hyphomicrobiaceae bacterium]|nr:isoprenylcysteine carboxylmethyltransferase family protein [Hyphomicrobiaceae bacterium]